VKSKTELQSALDDLAENRVQLKNQLRHVRTDSSLARGESNEAVLEILRLLDCVKSRIYCARQQLLYPEEFSEKKNSEKRNWYSKNKSVILSKQKEYYHANSTVILKRCSAYSKRRIAARNSDPEFIRQRDAQRATKLEATKVRKREATRVWNASNRERIKVLKAEHYRNNCEKIKAKVRTYGVEYRKRPEVRARLREKDRLARQNPEVALRQGLRCRIRSVLLERSTYKQETTETLIGCTIIEFRAHIESKFVSGMSWANRSEWHLDHIKPCAKFDLTDPKQQLECFNFRNIQPLWKLDNLRKGSK